jgi:hypothetical protein
MLRCTYKYYSSLNRWQANRDLLFIFSLNRWQANRDLLFIFTLYNLLSVTTHL